MLKFWIIFKFWWYVALVYKVTTSNHRFEYIIFLRRQVVFPKFLGDKDPHDLVHLFHNFFRLLLEIFVDLELGLGEFLGKRYESLRIRGIFNLFQGFHTLFESLFVFFKKIGFFITIMAITSRHLVYWGGSFISRT